MVGTVGLFGKIPAKGDFIRLNAADPVCQAMDRWLQDGIAEAKKAGDSGAAVVPFSFVFTLPTSKNAVIGALAPSRDSAGRSSRRPRPS